MQPACGRVQLQVLPIADTLAQAMSAGLGWLSEAEQLRFSAMHDAARRASFLAGHWQARCLAVRWFDVMPSRLSWHVHADGRPGLLLDGEPSPLFLSVSHSADWLAVALADVPIGIDIELAQRTRDWLALAKFVFSEEEVRDVQMASASQQAAVFQTYWALKEAHGKQSGTGILPRQARLLVAKTCKADLAEARSWGFQTGALALAMPAQAHLEITGEVLETARYWRYSQAPLAAVHALRDEA